MTSIAAAALLGPKVYAFQLHETSTESSEKKKSVELTIRGKEVILRSDSAVREKPLSVGLTTQLPEPLFFGHCCEENRKTVSETHALLRTGDGKESTRNVGVVLHLCAKAALGSMVGAAIGTHLLGGGVGSLRAGLLYGACIGSMMGVAQELFWGDRMHEAAEQAAWLSEIYEVQREFQSNSGLADHALSRARGLAKHARLSPAALMALSELEHIFG